MNGVNKGKGKLGEDELQTEQRKVLEVNELVERVRQNWRAARWTSEIVDELRNAEKREMFEMTRAVNEKAGICQRSAMKKNNNDETQFSGTTLFDSQGSRFREIRRWYAKLQEFRKWSAELNGCNRNFEWFISRSTMLHYDGFELLLHRNSTATSMLLHIVS